MPAEVGKALTVVAPGEYDLGRRTEGEICCLTQSFSTM